MLFKPLDHVLWSRGPFLLLQHVQNLIHGLSGGSNCGENGFFIFFGLLQSGGFIGFNLRLGQFFPLSFFSP